MSTPPPKRFKHMVEEEKIRLLQETIMIKGAEITEITKNILSLESKMREYQSSLSRWNSMLQLFVEDTTLSSYNRELAECRMEKARLINEKASYEAELKELKALAGTPSKGILTILSYSLPIV